MELTHTGKFRNVHGAHLGGSPQSLIYKPLCLSSLRKDSFTLFPVIGRLRVSERARCQRCNQSMGKNWEKGSPEYGGLQVDEKEQGAEKGQMWLRSGV